eukprot:GFYU01011826.1.p1 GENE.GFYU01011826.1~~GFYU01011826.1.p1  ORF type:complete len:191 (+),score=37.76 GFYU01011826.1:28-600(+)
MKLLVISSLCVYVCVCVTLSSHAVAAVDMALSQDLRGKVDTAATATNESTSAFQDVTDQQLLERLQGLVGELESRYQKQPQDMLVDGMLAALGGASIVREAVHSMNRGSDSVSFLSVTSTSGSTTRGDGECVEAWTEKPEIHVVNRCSESRAIVVDCGGARSDCGLAPSQRSVCGRCGDPIVIHDISSRD